MLLDLPLLPLLLLPAELCLLEPFLPLPDFFEPDTTIDAFIGTHFVDEVDFTVLEEVAFGLFFFVASKDSTGILDTGISDETDFHGDFVGKGAGVSTGSFLFSVLAVVVPGEELLFPTGDGDDVPVVWAGEGEPFPFSTNLTSLETPLSDGIFVTAFPVFKG